MRRLALMLGLSLAALGGPLAGTTHAQSPQSQGPQISIVIGPALQAKAKDFGPQELDTLRDDLRQEVTHAFAHASSAPARVDLVIEDATPNRPTFAQLGRTVGLSMHSVGVGGARVSGMVTGQDGSSRPLRYQYYETDLREERGADTWSDADRSFMMLANDLRHGQVSDRYTGPGPSHDGGHFGYPFGD